MTPEHYNLAGEYIKARDDGGTCLTLDEYVELIRVTGQFALVLDEDEIDHAFRLIGYC